MYHYCLCYRILTVPYVLKHSLKYYNLTLNFSQPSYPSIEIQTGIKLSICSGSWTVLHLLQKIAPLEGTEGWDESPLLKTYYSSLSHGVY